MTTQVGEMGAAQPPLRCANCRITIRAERVIVGGRDYCCEGCARGGPCCC
ncbi:MAG TPA: hypothetical protein VFW12_07055 [Candidatus Limnocylindria bacterium]|nr:hypothetical protein [Candidatus Limnocylindria bacterium]